MMDTEPDYDARPVADGEIVEMSLADAKTLVSIMYTIERMDDVSLPEWYGDNAGGVRQTLKNVENKYHETTRDGFRGVSDTRTDSVMVPAYMCSFLENLFELLVDNKVCGSTWDENNGRGSVDDVYEAYYDTFNKILPFGYDVPDKSSVSV